MNLKSSNTIFIYTFLLYSFSYIGLSAQSEEVISWWNPINSSYPVVNGNAWTSELASLYHRLPKDAEPDVEVPLWELSKQSAGLSIRFWSNSNNIRVKYTLKGALEMPHMPATGVSGLDLYKKTKDGEWQRLWGHYKLDSVSHYTFNNKDTTPSYIKHGAEYQLFLPLYNEVSGLEIGVNSPATFKALPRRNEKPIVAYGTSICQGACASRPGMAWTNILERNIERPVVNLGFSGNGKLEPEIIDLMAQIDAKVFILDCLPNLRITDNPFLLTINAVKKLKEKHPSTPIILTAHAGHANTTGPLNADEYMKLNEDLENAMSLLKSFGHKRIYMLKKEDLQLNFDSFVDNTHPNDIGMQQYAEAYETLIRNILRTYKGTSVTSIPTTQARDIAVYNWEERHQEILTLNKTNPPKICLFGDSITHFWGGEPEAPITRGSTSWKALQDSIPVRNFGFGWDRIENVLWRIHHDELDGFIAEKIILLVGTNNLLLNSEKEILIGIETLINAIKQRQPTSEILLLGILPRVGKERQVSQLNLKMGMFALQKNIEFNHIGNVLLLDTNKIDASLFTDGLHPNKKGYELLSAELNNVLNGVTEEE